MITPLDLIEDLEAAAGAKDVGRRAELLRRLTDLFVSGWSRYSEQQVDLFDDVMNRLCVEVETAARSAMSRRLAGLPNAPRGLVRKLALDDEIEVAGPVLAESSRLDESTLIEVASTKNRDHLLAIARRVNVNEAVTDVLVDRGDETVLLNLVENPGARLSDDGCSSLVSRATTDDRLALGIWSRPDVPRHHMVRLLNDACEAVRIKLETQDRQRSQLIRNVLSEVSETMQHRARSDRHDYERARQRVHARLVEGRLDATALHEFAVAGLFDETAIGLSLMCNLPIEVIERGMIHDRIEPLLVFAKSVQLGWETVKLILVMRAGDRGCSAAELEGALKSYTRLKPDTAQKAVVFYRLREQARNSVPQG